VYYLGLCKYTFAQRRNRPTTHFSERIPVVKRRISVHWMKTRIFTWEMWISHSLRPFFLFFKIILHHVIRALPSESEQAKVATSCTFLHYENTVHHQSYPSDQTGNQYYHREVAAVSEEASPPKILRTMARAGLVQAALRCYQKCLNRCLILEGATLKGASAKSNEGKSIFH